MRSRYRGRVVRPDIHAMNLHAARRKGLWRFLQCWWQEKSDGFLA